MNSVRSKCFPNPYKDWGESESDVVKIDGDKITFKHGFISKLTEMKQHLYMSLRNLMTPMEDGSVYTGSAGVAMLELNNHLEGSSNSSCEAAVNMFMEALATNKNNNLSFLTGKVGPIALAVIAYSRLENLENTQLYCDKLLAFGQNPCLIAEKSDELLYGRAGYLYALLFVKNYVPPASKDSYELSVRNTIEAIFNSGKTLAEYAKSPNPLKFEWHKKEYLGAAHGYAGIYHTLLLAAPYLKDDEKQLLKVSIDKLLETQLSSKNFPSSIGNQDDRLVQWCHGAPGFVDLLCRSYKVYNEEKYLNIAKECGNVIWRRGLLCKGYSLCHGIAGNGYALLSLFQTTKDVKYLHRACKFVEWCFSYDEYTSRKPDHPLSLYEGIVGVMYFMESITDPENAAMPGYTFPIFD